jgi:hypothetical protein
MKGEQPMTEIYLVEYCYDNYDEYTIYPIKAFKDKQKAELFINDCKEECLRVDLELQSYWSKHQQEYDEMSETIKEKVRKKQFSRDMPEIKRRMETMEGEHRILRSHKYLPDYRVDTGGQFLCETKLELVE